MVLCSLGMLVPGVRAGAQDLPARLFLDNASFPEAPLQAASSSMHATFVRLDPSAISRLKSSPAPPLTLTLNLCSNEQYAAVLDRHELLEPGRAVWRGRVDGQPGSYVTLALSGEAVAGSVFVPGRGMFQIQHAGNGWQRIIEIDGSHVPQCGVQHDSRPSARGFSADDFGFQAASSPGDPTNAVIDLLIVYTPAARDGAGGVDGMNALIDAAVAEANLAFENSQVNAQLRLVHRAEVNYAETGDISEDLNALEDDAANGPFISVHQLRAQYRTDLVCMITETTGGPYGLANQMHDVEVEFGDQAFSVVQREYAISYQALAHEIGHNLGCQHDRATSSSGGAFDFSHAHRFEAGGTLYHTIMAYQPGLPIPYYSNPDVLFMGVPTGIPESSPNSANNAKTINLSAATVARFDTLIPTGAPPQITLVAPTNGAVFIVPAVLELTAEASDPDGQVVEVEFYVNGQSVGDFRHPPFTMLWTNGAPGTFIFRGEARDDTGWRKGSPPVTVTFTYPPPFIDPAGSRRLEDGSFQVRVRGIDGQAFRLDVSQDLVEWSPLTTDSFSGDIFGFVDLQATNSPARFYRVLPVP